MANRIDVVVPTHRAHATLGRTLASLAEQTIASDLDVIVVDDACPEGGYQDVVAPFRSRVGIRLVRLDRNVGPGGARQAGIDAGQNPYVTCIDADDAFARPDALELLRRVMDDNPSTQRLGGGIALHFTSGKVETRNGGGVSMDGKLFRRSFVERYGLRFAGTRANEDFGYNLAVDLLCDHDGERVGSVPEVVVDVFANPRSITATNDGQFAWDQRLCGFVDNSIWAFDLVKRFRPSSKALRPEVLRVLLIAYCYWCIIASVAPEYADQAWEYAKKYYHLCYRHFDCPAFASMEAKLTPETTPRIFAAFAKRGYFDLPEGVEIPLRFDEFLARMQGEGYDPERIYAVWEQMAASPGMRSRMEANEEIGVCEKGYAKRPDPKRSGHGIGGDDL